MTLPTLDTLDVEGKRVLVRSDLNVPLDNGAVADDFRIRASLPTIAALRDRGARVIVASHLGRPTGVDSSFSMAPVSERLGELGGFPVMQADGVYGPEVETLIAKTADGSVVVLENTRFEPGESKNDPEVAEGLAALADVFVNDAFGTAHRAHASNVGVAERLPSAAGRLLALPSKVRGYWPHSGIWYILCLQDQPGLPWSPARIVVVAVHQFAPSPLSSDGSRSDNDRPFVRGKPAAA